MEPAQQEKNLLFCGRLQKGNQVDAKDDYVQIPWGKDTAINVLNNDRPIENLIPRSVTVIEKPLMGTANVDLSNGFIMYKPIGNRPGRDKFVYQVCDASNTCDLATVTIDIYDNGVKTTEGFSPNGDGVNDKFVFDGLLPGYPNSQLYVYTRAGQLVFKSDNYKNEWDGTSITSSLTNQELVPTGVYYYILKFGGTNRSMKGFVYVGY